MKYYTSNLTRLIFKVGYITVANTGIANGCCGIPSKDSASFFFHVRTHLRFFAVFAVNFFIDKDMG